MKPAHYVRFLVLPSLLVACLPKLPPATTDDADGDGVVNDLDCDDEDPIVGEGDPWYLDADDDSYGDPDSPSADPVCPGMSGPEGYLPEGTDCDDHHDTVNPGAAEIWYDGVDQDCDGNDDDQDLDGFVASLAGGDDCDDTDSDSNPDSTEIWYDGVDQDCDGNDCDQDGDGYCVSDYASPIPDAYQPNDCDDADIAYNPGADESNCSDPNDYNCDGSTGFADDDGDGVPACEECDDQSAASYPGAIEICDGVDNDCDGSTDVGATDEVTWYADLDGDGYGDSTTAVIACDNPGAHVTDGTDCDDTHASFHPGADESDCGDPNDYNCDGSVGYDDADGDGSAACLDCDDGDPADLPGGTEVCDGADNDCNGAVDDDASDAPLWYSDADTDGFGDPGTFAASCTAPAGTVADDTDCDDTDRAVNPGATELCDAVDNDCDGTTDIDATDATPWYADADSDTFGDAAIFVAACEAPIDHVADDSDCDDADPTSFPGGVEVCDGADNNCDGTTDEPAAEGTLTWYVDVDNDDFGSATTTEIACDQPIGFVLDASDCNDTDDTIWPGADEYCDGADHDCDRLTFEEDSVDAALWHRDADSDTFGSVTATANACSQPSGYVTDATDCDDTALNVHPGAAEGCNGFDDDCDGLQDDDDTLDPSAGTEFYADIDGDGYGDLTVTSLRCSAAPGWATSDDDCDDANSAIHPGAPDLCDGLDNDCTSISDDDPSYYTSWYADLDSDGFGDAADTQDACDQPDDYVSDDTDCNDADPSLHADADGDGVCEVSGWRQVSAGGSFTCGIDNTGAVQCWGRNEYGQAAPPVGTLTAVSAGFAHTCGIDSTGAIQCWGADWYGQATSPVGTFTALSAGTYHSCGIDTSGVMHCWGLNDDGQATPPTGTFTTVSSGGYHACGIDSSGAIQCWGLNDDGQSSPPTGTFTAVSGGAKHTCALDSSGAIHCWGGNINGCSTPPTGAFSVVSAGWFHTCGVDSSGAVQCWGTDTYGQASAPVGRFTAVSAGENHTCGIDSGGDIQCWGENGSGECSPPSASNFPPSTPIAAITPTEPADSDDLLCTGSGSVDPDGDTVSYTYSWTVDGVDPGIATDTVPAASTNPDEVWECSVVATDGSANSAAATASVTIGWDYTTAWGSEMIPIPAGTFVMGGGAGDPDATYLDHEVTLTHDFWIGGSEVTQEEWSLFAGAYDTTPSNHAGCASCPVENVSWSDAAQYANALSAAEGLTPCHLADGTDLAAAYLADPYSCPGYRLPTEAEWEYAARAGEDTTYSGSDAIGDVAWYNVSSAGATHSVCGLDVNNWGLCDMSGNVWEPTTDWYGASHGGYADGKASTDPTGPSSGSDRVIRGGYWDGDPVWERLGSRYYYVGDRNIFVGFRLARTVP